MLTTLLIDDEPLTTQALRKILENHFPNIEVLGEATDGRKAWEIIQNRVPDFIISDIRMPNLDGLELLDKIRHAELPIKVILLTAYGEFEYAHQALKLGASGYLLKPYIQSELIKEVFRVTKEIEAENGYKSILSKAIPLFEENALKKLLVGKLDSTGLHEFLEMAESRWEHCVVSVLQLGGSNLKAEEIEEVIKISITEEINSHLFILGYQGISFFRKLNEIIMIHVPKDTDSDLIQGCIRILMNYTHKPFQVGSSQSKYRPQQLSEAYQDALQHSAVIPDLNISKTSTDHQVALIDKAVDYCKRYYTTDINLQKIADHLDINKYHFCNLFKDQLHITFWDYVTNLRVDHAKNLLQTSEERVSSIAIQSGYINSSHFGRVFKEITGVTPAEYRRQTKTSS
ncbi:response regulator [Paenibacillus sp. HWE-109]|uniref:response regulator n=1 Tax=Paenibacillus sp. HWE-109 TaxID=1306526 RepID=UPI001EDD5544|nr:response regulator [Paenibacillus sp. HWE-109]UKS28301.1 response regulator [Paenibacillus sp. HWE-109]